MDKTSNALEHNIFVVYSKGMLADSIISTDKQAREVQATIDEIDAILSSEELLAMIVDGLPIQAVEGVRRSITTERRKLSQFLSLYDEAKAGDPSLLLAEVEGEIHREDDLGNLLIAARIAKGLKQKELAQKLGLREQAVQRYEAEKYRSISLSNFQKFIHVLGVKLSGKVEESLKERFGMSYDLPTDQRKKIVKHAREHGWLEKQSDTEETAMAQIRRRVADHVNSYGTPSLLRTGLNVVDHAEDWSLLAWKAQVTRRAEAMIDRELPAYDPLNVKWLIDLVRLSSQNDGPRLAIEFLRERGIIVVTERNISGMRVDGAAFLVRDIPVIGLTLRTDTIDSFWFSLLHEIAHVVLHYRTGLSSGFFDEFGHDQTVDELEQEADNFAGNLLIPEEKWRRSPARISDTPAHIETFAKGLGIHPAIVFGRIRMERNNYKIFSNKIGRGTVRKQFFEELG